MIAQLTGNVVFTGERYVILDVGGVGYKVYLSMENLRLAGKKKDAIRLWTHLAVREDAMDLYGFIEKAELEFFELLIGISGIGPRSALGILNIAPVENIKKAVSSGDSSYLTKVSGIGRKTAEKIIIELRDKLGAWTDTGTPELQEEADAIEALQSLGYSQHEARSALKKVPREILGAGSRVKEALKLLGNGK
ncbi:MAG: Holliday junction branch migration protein RuvA [Candidatus Paceibacterota bacterium]|jgi:Holliday junction DNA helicase RuvA